MFLDLLALSHIYLVITSQVTQTRTLVAHATSPVALQQQYNMGEIHLLELTLTGPPSATSILILLSFMIFKIQALKHSG